MDLQALEQQYRGSKFGELVLHHHRKLDLPTVVAAMQGIIAELPGTATPVLEHWIDDIAPLGKDEAFWRRDCSEVFRDICGRGRQRLRDIGVEPTDGDVFNMFQVIVLNFAYGFHKDPQAKAFVQKAIGIGFLRRLFSG